MNTISLKPFKGISTLIIMEYQTNAEQDNEDELITFYIQYYAQKQKSF